MTYCKRLSAGLLCLLVALITGCAGASAHLTDAQKARSKEIRSTMNVMAEEGFSHSDTILVPTAYVYFLTYGEVRAVATGHFLETDGNVASAKMKVNVQGIDKVAAQLIARQLHEAVVTNLRNRGWNVKTLADYSGKLDMKGLDPWKPDKKTGYVKHDFQHQPGKDFMTVGPTDDTLFKPAFQGNLWNWRHIARKEGVHVAIPTFVFEAPQLMASTDRGFNRREAKVSASPTLTMTWGHLELISPKGWISSVGTKGPIAAEGDVGTLAQVSDDSPTVANALTAGFRALGVGGADRSVGTYALTVNPAAYRTAALGTAREPISLMAELTAMYKPAPPPAAGAAAAK